MSARESVPAGLLRFVTAGSVDDGKSTLIGRLLHDSKGLHADQLDALQAASRRRGFRGLDLSLVTDGLIAEREQGITIDVAYRYFATPARKFVIGDCPGHVQYTRNMVTAASTADLAILLVDARAGIVAQTRRHAFVAHWLGVPEVLLAVNKMDLVGWDPQRFAAIADEFAELATTLGFERTAAIPLSALDGDLVVERGDAAPWYRGPTLLERLEAAPGAASRACGAARLPGQRVARVSGGNRQPGVHAHGGAFRGYQGTLASGTLAPGDAVVAQPSGTPARVERILGPSGELGLAIAGDAITVQLDREIDVARGDVLAQADRPAQVLREPETELCWFDDAPLDPSRSWLLKQGATTVRARVARLERRFDIEGLEWVDAHGSLSMNDIGRVRLELQRPIAADPYACNRALGSFILIDEASHRTVAAGTIAGTAAGSVVGSTGP